MTSQEFDFIIIGSGFGGSVAAMRLTQKGYRVALLERGKRFADHDFPTSNWRIRKHLWAPLIRCFGIWQISLLKGVMILHGSGVGGGSLTYANVLEVPDDRLFNEPSWKNLADWKSVLQPHYEIAQRMLGVAPNPVETPADKALRQVAADMGQDTSFRATRVGVYFGPEGETLPDPYFGGQGPERTGCTYCGGCMVGCRFNAKNTLVKNYLYFAEKWGARVIPEAEVTEIMPLDSKAPDGPRFQVAFRSSTAWFRKGRQALQARNVIVSAGVLGTLKLLLHCRDVARTLPALSPRLGERVRTNSEALLGVLNPRRDTDYSKGVAISSVFNADPVTRIEPVRFSEGSSFWRLIATPILDLEEPRPVRFLRALGQFIRRPRDLYHRLIQPGWAERATIFLVMQTEDNLMRLRYERNLLSLFRRSLVPYPDEIKPIPVSIEVGRQVTRAFAQKTGGIASGSILENLLDIPSTAHILGGCPMGRNADEGVVDLNCEVHGYPGLFVVDGSIVPANPGVNPSLTITALAEYAMSRIRENSPPDGEREGFHFVHPDPLGAGVGSQTDGPQVAEGQAPG